MNLLVLYPKEFNCFSKFQRKVSKIIDGSAVNKVIYSHDSNNLINQYFSSDLNKPIFIEKDDWLKDEITHAIIFDDGEEFSESVDMIKDCSIPMRRIKISITRVVNIKKDTKFNGQKSTSEYEYIGRGSYWGNPYSMYEEGDDRDEVIRKFKYDFDFDKFPNKIKSDVYKLAGKHLGCFCKPKACHGDVLANFLNGWDDGK